MRLQFSDFVPVLLVVILPCLILFLVGVCNDRRRREEKRAGTYHSEPSQVEYTLGLYTVSSSRARARSETKSAQRRTSRGSRPERPSDWGL